VLPGAPANAKKFWIPLTNAVLHDPRTEGPSIGENWLTHGVTVEGLEIARPPKETYVPVTALINQLDPATLYTIRILGKNGDTSEASRPFLVRTARASLLTSRPLGLSVGFAALLVCGVWYGRRRAEFELEEEVPAPLAALPAKANGGPRGPFTRELGPGSFEIVFLDDTDAGKSLKQR